MSVKPRIGISRLQVAAMNVAAAVLLLAAVLADPAQAAQRVALVIGNGDYGRFAELRNPANDARAMAEKLRSVGFKLVGDKAHVDVKHRRMARLLRDLQNLLSRSGPSGDGTGLLFRARRGPGRDQLAGAGRRRRDPLSRGRAGLRDRGAIGAAAPEGPGRGAEHPVPRRLPEQSAAEPTRDEGRPDQGPDAHQGRPAEHGHRVCRGGGQGGV